MAAGLTGVRRNLATLPHQERIRLRDAIVALNRRFYPGKRTDRIPGGVSFWFKQDEIHQATHVHGGPEFLPWHRELCNRFETLLREVDPRVALHYWDWTTDPRPLFTADLMGSPSGEAGEPWRSARFYVPGANPYRAEPKTKDDPDTPEDERDTIDEEHNNPVDPPRHLKRGLTSGPPRPGAPDWPTDADILSASTFRTMRARLEQAHNKIHSDYVGGIIRSVHASFRDPFVFLLHSNVDRLFAHWQLTPGQQWRLDPSQLYGEEAERLDDAIAIDPWANTGRHKAVRPWAPPENEQEFKTYRDPSVVTPPAYDSLMLTLQTTGVPTVLQVNEGGFGPFADFLDVEVVTRLDNNPGKAFGFQLRNDGARGIHEGMLAVLRTGFSRRLPVLIDYQTFVGRNNAVLIRAALSR